MIGDPGYDDLRLPDNDDLPDVKPKPKKNTGEEKWRKRWYELHPDVPLKEQAHFKPPGKKMPYRIDFLHEETKVAVEISGGVHSIQKRRRSDYEKHRHMNDHGYTLYQYDAGYDMAKCRIDDAIRQVHNRIVMLQEQWDVT